MAGESRKGHQEDIEGLGEEEYCCGKGEVGGLEEGWQGVEDWNGFGGLKG